MITRPSFDGGGCLSAGDFLTSVFRGITTKFQVFEDGIKFVLYREHYN